MKNTSINNNDLGNTRQDVCVKIVYKEEGQKDVGWCFVKGVQEKKEINLPLYLKGSKEEMTEAMKMQRT